MRAVHFRTLIRKDGNLNVQGRRDGRMLFSDMYHYLLSVSWPRFFAYLVSVYLLINVFFGILYFICGVDALGDGHAGGLERFKHCFLLSVETMTAIEYGRVPPSGFGVYALMTMQALSGLLTLAVITGLFYARFARPTARLIFSNKAIIGPHNGILCFSFRVANERL